MLAAQLKTAKLIYNIVDEDLSLERPAKRRVAYELHNECTCPVTQHRIQSNITWFQMKGLLSMARS